MAALMAQAGLCSPGVSHRGEVERARAINPSARGRTRWKLTSTHTAKDLNARCCFSAPLSSSPSVRRHQWAAAEASCSLLRERNDTSAVRCRAEKGASAAEDSSTSGSDESSSYGEHCLNILRKITEMRAVVAAMVAVGAVVAARPGLAWAGGASTTAMSSAGKGLVASGWAGLVAGCLHTLTGPDHLAALAPLCIGRSRLQSAAVGALWGCGHDAGQIIFGLVFLLLKDRLQIELIRTWSSRVVGLTLMTIGAMGVYESHEPLLVAAEGSNEQVKIKNDSRHATTFATGVVYGLQPDALLMILPAIALPSRGTGAAFLGMFLVGTVLAMGSYTLFLSSCSRALQKKLPGITKRLTLGSSLIALALGLGVIVSEFFGISLF